MTQSKMRGLSAVHVLGILVVAGVVALFTFAESDSEKRARLEKEAPARAGAAQPAAAQQLQLVGGSVKAGELAATMINLNGHLCAQVVGIRPLKVRAEVHEVTCIEYRGGSGQKVYMLDSTKGTVWLP